MELFPSEDLGVRTLTLTRLASDIARALAPIGRVAVEGEVVRPSRGGSGGVWFVLKDRTVQVSVRCPASRVRSCRVVDGERVRVTATLQWQADRGQVQLVAEEVVPTGDGAIAAMLAEVRARLVADGLVDRPRRLLPVLPERIGVVCGTDAAVKADIESVVTARFPGYPVEFVATNVSGPGAAEAVSDAVRTLDARPEIEVIVLARGGGDATQLLPFSDERLCRVVAACSTPVVSAIGHDGDRPLCDDVADHRHGTPSLAAAAVVPDRAVLEAQLARSLDRAGAAAARRVERAGSRLRAAEPGDSLRVGLTNAERRLARAGRVLAGSHPRHAAERAGERLARVAWRRPLPGRVDRCRLELAAAARHLDALSPQRVLERGYAVVRPAGSRRALRSADGIARGDRLDVQLAGGSLRVEVAGVTAVEVAGGRERPAARSGAGGGDDDR